MRLLALILIALTAGMLAACDPPRRPPVAFDPDREVPISIALSALIADPERYDGQYVSTQGVIATGFYDWHLYLSHEDYDGFVNLNGAALDVYAAFEGPAPALERMEGEAVLLTGVFYDGVSGHLGMERGLIVVEAVQELHSRQQLNPYYERPIIRFPLPWLLFIGFLAVAVALAVLSRPVPERRRAWAFTTGLACLLSIFSIVEANEASFILQYGWRLTLLDLAVIGLTVVLAVAGAWLMWAFWRQRRVTLMLAMMAIQLLGPLVREFRRLETWPSQLVYPFRPEAALGRWERRDWPSASPPPVSTRSEMGEPELPSRTQETAATGQPASSTLEPSPPAPQ